MFNIAKNIKEYRISYNMKQTEMAELLEMNYQNYSKLERGAYIPSLDKLLDICDILVITSNDLLLMGREADDLRKEIFEKYTWRNEDYWELADCVYYKKLDEVIRKASDKALKVIVEENKKSKK